MKKIRKTFAHCPRNASIAASHCNGSPFASQSSSPMLRSHSGALALKAGKPPRRNQTLSLLPALWTESPGNIRRRRGFCLVSHYSAISDTISCDVPYSTIGFRGRFSAIRPFCGNKWVCRSDSLRHHRKYSVTGFVRQVSRDQVGWFWSREAKVLLFWRSPLFNRAPSRNSASNI